MRLVITGALGHIGSRLVRDLPVACPDADVVMIDNLSTQRYASLFHLPQDGRYRFVEGDIVTADLDGLCAGADAVVHLAAITNAPESFERREEVERVNLAGTERVARACARGGCALVFPSTTSVYGTQREIVDEDCPPADLRPQSPYAESKLKAERLLRALGESEGLRFVTCRFGTVFGTSPGMRFHTAVNKFCWQAVLGQPLTVWRTALHQKRPYLDLTDAVAAVAHILRSHLFDGRIYNVLTLNATVQDIVDVLRTHVPDLSLRYVDTPIMNQLSYMVSVGRFRGTGFEFRGDLERGVRDTLQWLRGVSGRQAAHAHP